MSRVDPALRDAAIRNTKGAGDVALDLRGAKHLRPQDQKLLAAQKPIRTTVPIEKPTENLDALPPWWWNPSNPASAQIPPSLPLARFLGLQVALREIDPDLGISYNGAANVWQLWYFKPGVMKESPWTNGWVHVKDFKPWQGTNYILTVVRYMDKMKQEMSAVKRVEMLQEERGQRRAKRRLLRFDTHKQRAGEIYDHTRIMNIGKGSKFATFHA
jgi:hypothetical protein